MLVKTTEKAVPSVRDRLARARGILKEEGEIRVVPEYRPLACVLSYVPPPWQSWDEQAIRRIREHDPGFVPIWRLRVFQTKAGAILRFLHHGVARYGKGMRSDPAVVNALRPTSGFFSRFPYGRTPNFIERWFEGELVPGSIRARYNLPPPTVLWGTWVERWVLETFWAATAAEKQAYHDSLHAESGAPIEAHHEWQHEESEAAYRQQGEAHYQQRLIDSIGVNDRKEAHARATGQWEEPTKPFVEVGGTAA